MRLAQPFTGNCEVPSPRPRMLQPAAVAQSRRMSVAAAVAAAVGAAAAAAQAVATATPLSTTPLIAPWRLAAAACSTTQPRRPRPPGWPSAAARWTRGCAGDWSGQLRARQPLHLAARHRRPAPPPTHHPKRSTVVAHLLQHERFLIISQRHGFFSHSDERFGQCWGCRLPRSPAFLLITVPSVACSGGEVWSLHTTRTCQRTTPVAGVTSLNRPCQTRARAVPTAGGCCALPMSDNESLDTAGIRKGQMWSTLVAGPIAGIASRSIVCASRYCMHVNMHACTSTCMYACMPTAGRTHLGNCCIICVWNGLTGH
eukprot:352223-Chlamydomonas_euryale.AAC.11